MLNLLFLNLTTNIGAHKAYREKKRRWKRENGRRNMENMLLCALCALPLFALWLNIEENVRSKTTPYIFARFKQVHN